MGLTFGFGCRFFWGYSLTFSETASPFIGNLRYFGLKGVLEAPSIGSSRVPALLFCIYQCMFATITTVLASAGFAERARIGPSLLFMFCWQTIVYSPIACWTWNANGWLFTLGAYDFAGGSPVHISSGTAAAAIALYLGKRKGYGTQRLAYKPHSTFYIWLGTLFLWFGWAGFNGGSGLGANLRGVMAMTVTNFAAASGGIAWMLLDWRLERKWSTVGFCSGAIVGLVGITPASGYVGCPASILIGVVSAAAANFATRLKFLVHIDEALDAFASHAVGGICGNLLTGLFAQASVAGLDGTVIPGGWLDHHYIQLGYQAADCCAAVGYSFVMTSILCWIFHFVPGLRLRCSEETEIVGIDDAELGEFTFDYIALDPELRLHRDEESKMMVTDSNADYHTHEKLGHHESNGSTSVEPVAEAEAEGSERPGGGRVDV